MTRFINTYRMFRSFGFNRRYSFRRAYRLIFEGR